MSLKVWLPLDGDLRNLGCDSLAYINVQSGVNIDDNGKIGKCYTNTGTNISIANSCVISSSAFTVCAWAKINSKRSNWQCFLGMSGNNTYLGLGCEHTNGTLLGFHFYKTIDGTNTSIFDSYPVNVKLETWVHYTMCYDGLKYYIYENGNLISSNSVRIPNTEVNMTNLYLFGRHTGGYSSCSLNDVRIYDHCLSPLEVKEISQGLVLHYKLDGPMGGNNLNLLNGTLQKKSFISTKNSRKTGQFENLSGGNGVVSIIEDATVPIGNYVFSIQNNTSGNKDFAQYGGDMPFNLIEGEKYTISAYYKGTGSSLLRIWDYTTNTQLISKITALPANASSEWVRIFHTFTATAVMNTDNIGCLIGVTGTSSVIMYGFKFEHGETPTEYCCSSWDLGLDTTIVEDSSGYGHNGTITGSLISDSNSSRYTNSSYIGSDRTNYVSTPNISFENMLQGTINIWINRKSYDSTWRLFVYFANSYNWTGNSNDFIIIGNTGGQGITLDCCSNTYTFTPELNKWYMYTITWDLVSHKALMYVNGELKSTKNSENIDVIYASKHNGHYFGNGYNAGIGDYLLSDARIYCTPLLDTDIKLLYNVSMKVDNLQNLHTFELNENFNSTSLTKQGILKTINFYENSYQSILQYDKTIYTEPDGSTWAHIFHHNNPANARFTNGAEDWSAGIYLDEDRWYDVEKILNNLIQYEFLVKQRTTDTAAETKWRWVQNINPLEATWEDVGTDACTYITNSGYSISNYNKGMYLFKASNLHMCIANNSKGNWYGGIGACNSYNGGIPGYPNTIVTTGYIDLYVRIYPLTKIIKNIGINTLNFIEM